MILKSNFENTNKYACLILISLLIVSTGWTAGRSGFPVLTTLMDARSSALAGANLTDMGYPNSVSLNPASGAGGITSGSTSFAAHTLDMWSGNLRASYRISSSMLCGGSLSTFDYGDFDYMLSESGATGEMFQASEYALSGYISASLFKSLAWGASARFVWGKLAEETAVGAVFDFGLIWDSIPGRTRIGLAVRNAGSQFNGYGDETDPMPIEIVIGGSNKLEHLPLTLHLSTGFVRTGDGDYILDWMPGKPGINFSAGGEFEIFTEGASKPFYVRLGYGSQGDGQRVEHRLDTLAGFSFGLGFLVSRFNLDYAYVPMGALGDVHRIGLSGKI